MTLQPTNPVKDPMKELSLDDLIMIEIIHGLQAITNDNFFDETLIPLVKTLPANNPILQEPFMQTLANSENPISDLAQAADELDHQINKESREKYKKHQQQVAVIRFEMIDNNN